MKDYSTLNFALVSYMLLSGSCITIDAWCYLGDKSDISSTALPGGTDTNGESSMKKVHFEKGDTCVQNKTVPMASWQAGHSSVVECSKTAAANQKPKQSKSRNVNEEENGVYEVEAILSHRKVSSPVMWSHRSSTPA